MIAGRDWSNVRVVGVARLANYLRRKLEADQKLAQIGVEGEISNLRVQSSGSWNFSLKDHDAVLECFAFPSDAATFPQARNGDALICYGRISTYEKKSTYQLQVRHVELAGVGRLYARYEELRRKLDAEGLFAESRKRPLPRFPFRVALVGSPTGEGTRDFLTQARARAPHVSVQLFETAVQGEIAAGQIVAALARACAAQPDLVVIARGGGSFEDLFVFSDERVVRAVANCPIPTVAAIGHEADAPLIDFAADRRASTPSTAAQTVLPRRDDLLRELAQRQDRFTRALRGRVTAARGALDRIERRSPLAAPAVLLATPRQRVDAAGESLRRTAEARLRALRDRVVALDRRLIARDPQARLTLQRERLDNARARLRGGAFDTLNVKHGRIDDLAERLGRVDPSRRFPRLMALLEESDRRIVAAGVRSAERRRDRLGILGAQLAAVDPEAPLQRGYAIVRRADGTLVRYPADAPAGTQLGIRLARGELRARVEGE